MTPRLITIDGPAASGKSSVSRELARRLGWKWISTGAFYRGLAYVADKEKVPFNDVEGLIRLCQSDIWSVRMDEDVTRVFYRDTDVTQEIMTEHVGNLASKVSQIVEVRQALLRNQRDCAVNVPGLIAEGRDCGTVVFPQAILKIYLTASQKERAARRARELGLSLEETQTQQQVRDSQDSSRAASPLQVPPHAKVIDSNTMNLQEVIDLVYKWAQEALAQSVKSF